MNTFDFLMPNYLVEKQNIFCNNYWGSRRGISAIKNQKQINLFCYKISVWVYMKMFFYKRPRAKKRVSHGFQKSTPKEYNTKPENISNPG